MSTRRFHANQLGLRCLHQSRRPAHLCVQVTKRWNPRDTQPSSAIILIPSSLCPSPDTLNSHRMRFCRPHHGRAQTLTRASQHGHPCPLTTDVGTVEGGGHGLAAAGRSRRARPSPPRKDILGRVGHEYRLLCHPRQSHRCPAW